MVSLSPEPTSPTSENTVALNMDLRGMQGLYGIFEKRKPPAYAANSTADGLTPRLGSISAKL